MKKIVLFLGLALSTSYGAQASEGKACSLSTNVCANYQSDVDFVSTQEGRFKLNLSQKAVLIKTDLWMQMGTHGHGSSPLKVTQVAPGQYDVTKAFFVMRGEWKIRVTYKLSNSQETLIFPVMIKE